MTDNTITEAVEVREGMEVAQAETLPAIDFQNAIDTAVTLGKDGVEVLERLQNILKMERDHAAEVAFNAAKNELFRRLRPIPKNRTATIRDGFQIKYADLAQIERSLREAGAYDLGFSWYWDTETHGDQSFSVCILKHEAGHVIKSRFPIERDTRENRAISGMQKERAATSYSDRTTLQRVFGITHLTEDTIDGEPPRAARGQTVSKDEALKLEATTRELCESAGKDFEEVFTRMLRWAGVDNVEDFPKAKLAQAYDGLKKLQPEGEQAGLGL